MKKWFSDEHNAKYGKDNRYTTHNTFHYRSLSLDKALPIKAFVISVVIFFLSIPSIGFLSVGGLQFNLTSFSSLQFISNLIITLTVIWLYDLVTARRKFLTQELYGSIFASIILTMTTYIVIQYTFIALVRDILVLFVFLYAAFWICNRRKIKAVLQFFGVLFVLVVLVKFLYTAQGENGLFTIFQTANNTFQTLNPTINDTWVHSFMATVNAYRSNLSNYNQSIRSLIANSNLSLHESPILDNLSKSRFIEMTSDGHYQITHYGAGGGSYGEVVFYPSGYSPEAYAQNVRTTAPLHWQLLVSPQFGYYGYYVGQGPVVEAEGSCNAPSELPGPNINVTQWFEGYGCTPIVVNSTWLVIDLT
jgi:hypothetical protein